MSNRTTTPQSPGRDLSLRLRLILGYSIVVSLTLIFGLFMFVHLNTIRDRLDRLSVDVTADTRYSVEVVAAVADVQRQVDRYLLQPDEGRYRDAVRQFDMLQRLLERLETEVNNPAMRDHLKRIMAITATYRQAFDDTSRNIIDQQRTRDELYMTFLQQYKTIEEAISNARPVTPADYLALMDLSRASTRLQLTHLWIGQMASDRTMTAADNAFAELRQARTFLRRYLILNPNPNIVRPDDLDRLRSVSESFDQSFDAIARLSANYIRTDAVVSTRLRPQAGQMSREAVSLSDTALLQLIIATKEIDQATNRTLVVGVGVLAALLVAGIVLGILLASLITRPLSELVTATARLARGEGEARVQPRGGRELALLAHTFNHMAAELERERAEVRHQNALLAERAAELEHTLAQLREETAAREQLSATVRRLSVPIIPIMEGVLVAPLVGEIDAERASLLQHRLLNQIVAERAQVAILDITGVPIVDSQVSIWLVQATTAARLLGARCVLVGINPEVSQALVASGVDLGDLVTRATLREGLEYAVRMLRRSSLPAVNGEQGAGVRHT
ncbi:MAG: STAS domain-containing protein [Roseiflexus sp.]